MPLFSLASEGGIGDMGKAAYDFIDRLSALGVDYWQILPLSLIDEYGCPYASPSAFGGEPLLIDLGQLGIAYKEEFSEIIDYDRCRDKKGKILRDFALEEISKESILKEMDQFRDEFFWSKELCVFLALRESYGNEWSLWPKHLLNISNATQEVFENYLTEFNIHLYLQMVFHDQWSHLKDYALKRGIQIIGDIPIFVSASSFDAWRWPELFKIDAESGRPLVITGAPPDEFNELGQLWGTLNYNWDNEGVFDWWLQRLKYSQALYHLTRIDHFVGFYHVWESSPDASDARLGAYIRSGGEKLLEIIQREFPELPFIAEDLGVLNDEIRSLRERFNYPTMRVYQFSLYEEGKPQTLPATNEHFPPNIPDYSFTYTGTHDNNTLIGWLEECLSDINRRTQIEERFSNLSVKDPDSLCEEIIRNILQCSSKNTIFPIQDIFHLSGNHRVNRPGTRDGNWNWRLSPLLWDQSKWKRFQELLTSCQRQRELFYEE